MTIGWRASIAVWLLALASTTGTASPEAAPYADGAPPGFSGGFKEQACDACHFEHDINARPGQLTLSGVPERYAPGERFTLTVTLAHPEMKIGGFQLTARMEGGGSQAGTLAPAPGEQTRVAIDSANGIQYARQRREGAGPAPPGILRWEVAWTAPAMPGLVMFHASGNAGNGDDFAGGDYVYTSVARSQGASSVQSQPPQAFEVATIRQLEAGVRIPSSMTVTPSRVDIVGYRLSALIFEAFKVPAYQLAYPDSLRAASNPRFEIHATIPAGATRAQLPQMLQALLRDRFGMVTHVESRSLPAYDLVVAAGGSKMREVEPIDERSKKFPPDPGEKTISDTRTGPSAPIDVIVVGKIERTPTEN